MTIDADIATFVAAYADAWTTGDVDGIADVVGLPQMLARESGTAFIEDDAALVAWIEERLADWEAHGVEGAVATVGQVQPLPDDAARVTIDWRLVDAQGATLLAFAAVDTLAADDGDWSLVVTDLAGEDAARAAAGW